MEISLWSKVSLFYMIWWYGVSIEISDFRVQVKLQDSPREPVLLFLQHTNNLHCLERGDRKPLEVIFWFTCLWNCFFLDLKNLKTSNLEACTFLNTDGSKCVCSEKSNFSCFSIFIYIIYNKKIGMFKLFYNFNSA